MLEVRAAHQHAGVQRVQRPGVVAVGADEGVLARSAVDAQDQAAAAAHGELVVAGAAFQGLDGAEAGDAHGAAAAAARQFEGRAGGRAEHGVVAGAAVDVHRDGQHVGHAQAVCAVQATQLDALHAHGA